MSRLTAYLRHPDLTRHAEIDEFLTLEMVLRFNGISSWVLDIDASHPVARAATLAHGIIVLRDETPILSGRIRRMHRGWSGESYTLTMSGTDDTEWLARRMAPPVPSGPPYTASAHDVRTGAAETVMLAYVNANLGPGATAVRRVSGLTIGTDYGRGLSVTGRARFVPMLELMQSLALAGGDLGFRIVQVGSGIEFQVYDPLDLTAVAVFSPFLGNLQGHDYSVEAPDANYVYVAGGGEGTARTFVEVSDLASIATYGRHEMFQDRRDTTVVAELTQAGNESIEVNQAQTSLSISPIDTEGLEYGHDYNLGDRVSVVIADETRAAAGTIETSELATIQDVIREVRIAVNADGEMVVPQIGTPGARVSGIERIFEASAALGSRVSQLERR